MRSTRRSKDAAEKSLENDEALRTPRKTRNPRALEAASFSFSICPSRSAVEKSSDFVDGHVRRRGARPHGAVHQFNRDLFELLFHKYKASELVVSG